MVAFIKITIYLNMFEVHERGIKLWHFENLLRYADITHFVSTRHGGSSVPPFNSLNLGLSSGDNPVRVMENRRRLAEVLGFNVESIITSWQVHEDTVRVITRESIAEDASYCKIPKATADAMITDVPHVCITVIIADCVPILYYDPTKKAIGIAHAGWKGTVKGITRKVVKSLGENFGSAPKDIIAGIGPSIGPCCYQVGPEVVEIVNKVFDKPEELIKKTDSKGRGLFDLWEANRRELIDAGIPEENIEISEQCTKCNHNTFFSYRYQGAKSGRLAAGIMLK